MTFATETAKSAFQLQYVLSIEGLGFPDDEYTPGGDWDGTVFTTSDQSGDLASSLGCTIHKGLMLPSGLSMGLDPETLEYRQGNAAFEIVDVSSDLETTFQPFKETLQSDTESLCFLDAGLVYASTTIDLDQSNPGGSVSPPVAGDVVFVGGREAVLLGTRSSLGGNAFRYSSSTRGYLGTRRGSLDPRAPINGDDLYWFPNTKVWPHNPFWEGRRAILWARVPGEATSNMVRLFHGKISKLRRVAHGTAWRIECDATVVPDILRTPRLPKGWSIEHAEAWQLRMPGFEDSNVENKTLPESGVMLSIDPGSSTYDVGYLGTIYSYRNRVAGGVNGAATVATGGSNVPQAVTESLSNSVFAESGALTAYLAGRPLLIDGKYITRAVYRKPDGDDRTPITDIIISGTGEDFGSLTVTNIFEQIRDQVQRGDLGASVVPLLDNMGDDIETSCWVVNNVLRRNILDVFLILLTSHDDAFFRADATGGTTTTVTFSAPGWTTDEWVGYAVHCTEAGSNNLGEARRIISNTSTTLTVAAAFSNAPTSTHEYQIRNTIYDVLPLGWGMCSRPNSVDVAAIEKVRDTYFPGAEVGRFVVGVSDDLDLWKLVTKEILSAYGMYPYIDPTTGKLSVRYVGHAADDGVDEDYTAVTESGIMPGGIGEIDLNPRPSIARANVSVRKQKVAAVRAKIEEVNLVGEFIAPVVVGFEAVRYKFDPSIQNTEDVRVVWAVNLPPAYETDPLNISAKLNSAADMEALAAVTASRLSLLNPPPPETSIDFAIKHALQLWPGVIASVSCTKLGAYDPYTPSSGWTNQICRVLETVIDIAGNAVRTKVQILKSVPGGKISPVLSNGILSGTMTKEVSPDGFTGNAAIFVQVRDGFDYCDMTGFAVNDRIELRDISGAFKEGPFVIASFGDNEAATVEAASTDRVNVTAAISSTLAAGDYICLSPWTSSNTSNMNKFAAFADSTNEELGSGDSPQRYV